MKRVLLLLFISACIIQESKAQKFADEFRPKHLGFNISSLSGVGVSYIHDFTYWDNLKAVAFFCYESIDDDRNSFFCNEEEEARYNLGLEYQRDVLENDFLRLHLIVGGSITNVAYKFTDCHSYLCNQFNRGIGLGLDVELIPGMALNFHRSYQYTTTFGERSMIDHGFGWGIGITFHFVPED